LDEVATRIETVGATARGVGSAPDPG